MSQIGSFPQVGLNIKKSLKPPPSYECIYKVNIQIVQLFYKVSWLSTAWGNNLNNLKVGPATFKEQKMDVSRKSHQVEMPEMSNLEHQIIMI